MKKNIFWGLIFTLLHLFTAAQSYNSAELLKGFKHQNLVRSWKYPYVVSHFIDNGKSAFVCSDFSGYFGTYSSIGFNASAQYTDPLPNDCHVLDFRILNDYVFFCGERKASSNPDVYNGIVGYFDLNQFLLGDFQPNNY